MPRFITFVAFALTILSSQVVLAQARASGGDNFTLFVTDSGQVWSVGKNSGGQLGLGHTLDTKSPTQIPGLSGVVAVAAGGSHSLALTSTGSLFAWGAGAEGQTAHASNADTSSPVQLSLPDVVAIAAGRHHSLALTASGDLYGFGDNYFGQLGTGDTSDRNAPVLILSGVSAIGAGDDHSLAVKSDATAWAWGRNAGGQLGINAVSSGATTTPQQMIGVSSAVAVYGGLEHSVIRLSDGTLKATGQNGERQLGDGTTAPQRLTAVAVSGLTNIQTVATGWRHNLALDDEGRIWVWGDGAKGAVGTGNQGAVNPPAMLSSPTDVDYIGVGWAHSIAIDTSGVVSTWGSNDAGELGDGTTIARWAPEAISSSGYAWRVATPTFSVAAGTYNVEKSVVIAVDTASATIRYTLDGTDPTASSSTIASGSSVSIDQSKTLKAKAWKTGMPDSAIKSAAYTLQALTPSITVPSGGPFGSPQNVSMQTGTSDATIRYTLDGTNPTASSSAYTSPLTLSQTTTIKSATFKNGWSASGVQTGTITFNYGALDAPAIDPATGNYAGSVSVTMSSTQSGATIRYTTNGSTPTASSTAYTGAIQISNTTTVKAKAFHSSYTTSGEAARTYTMSAAPPTLSVTAGSYAPGSVVTISTPEATATLRMTIDGNDPTSTSPIVASGTSLILGNFTLKVKAFRSGVGDSAIASATYSLTSALGPGALTTGGSHTVLATPDGRLLVWGNNLNGQLGNEATTDRPTPTVINTITGVTALASGLAHTLALRADGQVYAFGSNGSGRLGNNSTEQSTRPVHVSTLSSVIAIAAGDTHSLALTSDGRVFSWGANTTGQLGLGDFGAGTERIVPTQITSLSNIVSIAAGDAQSFAVTSGGQAYAWGANGNSRLGDGGTSQQNSPLLLGLSNIVSIAAGQAHTLALTSGGRVYGFGANSNGQLGIAATATVATPTLIPNLHVSAVVAGDNHSGVIRADGALVMFGNSSSGQVGSGAFTATISTPALISGLSNVSTLSLGDLHSVAVTSTGDVLAWGESADYRLGNNATSPDKSTPQSILTGLTSWAPAAPTINVASGTLGATTTVTLASSTSGAVIRYTLNGALPTGSDPEVPANGQIEISYSSLLRARAFVTGRQAVVAPARSDYELQSAAPVISPGTGTYNSAQTVNITATGAPGEVRYTLDGSEPTLSSSLYSTAIGVSTGTTLKAKTFPSNGWSASPAATALLSFNFGTLDSPTASPAGGIFAAAPQVTLNSIAGASIRYTLNGTTPTGSSTLYSGPITIPGGGATVKSIALHSDWASSAIRTDVYTVDTTPPSIQAQYLPSALNSWNRTAVTVKFHCFDNQQIASCSQPTTFSAEGVNQTATGVAVDTAGNQTQLPITVNLDFEPPTVALLSPANGLVTSNTSLEVSGNVADTLSGLEVVTCNGSEASVEEGEFACSVTLRAGRNVIVVSARDNAGNNASTGITVTLVGTITQLQLTPDARTLIVGESATLTLRDNFGIAATNGNWQTSDPEIVSLSNDDPPVLTAVAEGTATVTASKNGFGGATAVTVVNGEVLPAGSTRWSLPTPTSTLPRRTAPIYTRPLSAGGPDFFTVEPNFTTSEYTVRAASAEGEVLWKEAAPGLPIMGDSYGALIAGIEEGGYRCAAYFGESTFCFTALARFGGTGDVVPWRYESAGFLDRPVQGPDGTVYVIEHIGGGRSTPEGNSEVFPDSGNNKSIVILDGATGRVTARVALAPETLRDACTIDENEPLTVPLAVSSDGNARVLVRRRDRVAAGPCTGGSIVSAEASWSMLSLSRNGVVSSVTVDECHSPSACDSLIEPQQLFPDSLKGHVLNVRRWLGNPAGYESRLIRFDSEGQRSDYVFPAPFRIDLVGDAGIVYLQTASGGSSVTQAFNLATGTAVWTVPPLTLLAAGPEARAAAQGPGGELLRINSAGQTESTDQFGLAAPVNRWSFWFGTTSGKVTAVKRPFFNTTFWDNTRISAGSGLTEPNGFGNQPGQSSPQLPCVVCSKNYKAPIGHGPVSASDKRRIITVGFGSGWRTLLGFGPPDAHIKSAAEAAIQMWNNKKTWAYFVLDEDEALGTPDVMIVKGICTTGAGYGCSLIRRVDFWGNMYSEDDSPQLGSFDHSIPSNMRLSAANSSVPLVHLAGRIAHELGHKLGIDGADGCFYSTSIMRGGNIDGTRDQNQVEQVDADGVNFALEHSEYCTITPQNRKGLAEELDQAATMRTFDRVHKFTFWPPAFEFMTASAAALSIRVVFLWVLAAIVLGWRPNRNAIWLTFRSGASVALLILLAVSSVACRGIPDAIRPRTPLENLAAEAKARGRNEITTQSTVERYTGTKLQEILDVSSIVVVVPQPYPQVWASESTVLTWQRFQVREWLQRKAPPKKFIGCPATRPPAPERSSDTIVAPLAQGTAVVDGVSITEATDDHIEFVPGRNYLLVGIDCSNQFMLLWGDNSVFAVSETGEISLPSYNDSTIAPFVSELVALRNTASIRAAIQSNRD